MLDILIVLVGVLGGAGFTALALSLLARRHPDRSVQELATQVDEIAVIVDRLAKVQRKTRMAELRNNALEQVPAPAVVAGDNAGRKAALRSKLFGIRAAGGER